MNPENKTVTIIVEATPHEWIKGEISYEEVVSLEFPNYSANITYTVIYERGKGEKPEGTMTPDTSVRVKERMLFHVSETTQS